MKLHFEVVSKDRYYLGDAASYTFNHQGGCIGRASSSSWVVEDINSFVSSTHLHITCHSNGFYITDVSTNGTFRGHYRLKRDVEDPMPLQVDDELRLGDVKMRVVSIEVVESTKDITEITPSPLTHSSSSSLDELEVLAQQARLADVISQCYPEIDHGQAFISSKKESQQERSQQNTDSNKAGASIDIADKDQNPLKAEVLLDAVIKVLFVQIQRQLAVDRIENHSYYETMSKDNIFRQAVSLLEFYSLASSPALVRADLQEVLRYLAERNSRIAE